MTIQERKDKICNRIQSLNESLKGNMEILRRFEIVNGEIEFAGELNHEFIGADFYDSKSKTNEKYELKNTYFSSGRNFVITGFLNKETIIHKIHSTVSLDGKDHYFFYSKQDIEYWKKEGWVTKEYKNGQINFSLDYNSKKYRTERKNYLRDSEVTLEQLKYVTNNFDKEEAEKIFSLYSFIKSSYNTTIEIYGKVNEFEFKEENNDVIKLLNDKIPKEKNYLFNIF